MRHLLHPLQSQRGVTLIEVMTAVAILGITTLLSLEVSGLRYGMLARVRSSYQMSEVVMANVTEAKARRAEDLTVGQCLRRIYNETGTFVSEATVANGSCGTTNLTNEEIEVYWKVSGPDDIDHEFTPSDSLKLPRYRPNAVLQVEVVGRRRLPPPSTDHESVGTVLFRKN